MPRGQSWDRDFSLWKYVDDATTSQVVFKRSDSKAQQLADRNRVELNCDKYKELRIPFARNQRELKSILVNGQVFQIAKFLGLTVTSNLSWNERISVIFKKASRGCIFLYG